MKRTDLEKNQAKKIVGKMNASVATGRLSGTTAPLDRREQRRLDQAAGLVAFPVKLRQPLITALRERAETNGVPLNDLVNQLLEDALKA